MGEALVFDLETDGFLEECAKIHMITIVDVRTGEDFGYTDSMSELTPTPYGNIHDGLLRLMYADILFAHNGHRFDWPVLEKLYPWFDWSYPLRIDTLIWGDTVRPHDRLIGWDKQLVAQGKLEPKLIGSGSLKAWGQRLGEHKGDYTGGWEALSQEMWSYGLQDGLTTLALVRFLAERKVPWQTMWIEQEVARIIAGQEAHGVRFDVAAGWELYGTIKQELGNAEREMVEAFGSWYIGDKTPTIPKVNRTFQGAQYTVGAPYTKVRLHQFNPGSRQDIASRLIGKYGWQPVEKTETGLPKVDEGTLQGLPWPEAKAALRFLMLQKRAGQLGDGAKAWLKVVDDKGYIHGKVNTNRANTRRMTHDRPNLAQVPNVSSPHGPEMRALFLPDKGEVMVGCDAQALEARGLASRMARYDGGEYARLVETNDVHRVSASYVEGKSPGDVTKEERDAVKTPFYALIFGAGDWKLGTSIGGKAMKRNHAVSLGKASRAKLLDAIPALKRLIKLYKEQVERHGVVRALDGQLLTARSSHSALNLVLQSDGALVMKVALIFADDELRKHGIPFHWVLNVHDEYQITTPQQYAEQAARIMEKSIADAGEYFGMSCKMEGKAKIGNNWRETH